MVYVIKNKKKEEENIPYWIAYMQQRIRQNKNCLLLIGGETGSGKSESSLSIANQIDPDFDVDRVIFSIEEMLELRKNQKLKKGSAIVYEEVGVEHDSSRWQSAKNIALSYLLQTFRDENLIVIFNVPYISLFLSKGRKLLHAYFETQKIDYDKKLCLVKPLLMQWNDRKSKMYYKRLRVRIKKKGLVPIDGWNIPKPPDELLKKYLEKKRLYKLKLDQELEAMILKSKVDKSTKFPQYCENCNKYWYSTKEVVARCKFCGKFLHKKSIKRSVKPELGGLRGF